MVSQKFYPSSFHQITEAVEQNFVKWYRFYNIIMNSIVDIFSAHWLWYSIKLVPVFLIFLVMFFLSCKRELQPELLQTGWFSLLWGLLFLMKYLVCVRIWCISWIVGAIKDWYLRKWGCVLFSGNVFTHMMQTNETDCTFFLEIYKYSKICFPNTTVFVQLWDCLCFA